MGFTTISFVGSMIFLVVTNYSHTTLLISNFQQMYMFLNER